MAEIRINATGGVKLYDADDSHYAQIIAGTITSNTDVMTLGHAAVVMGTKLDMNGNNLILDADADTYLDGGTADDIVDVYVAGAKDWKWGANSINVLSGTTLTIDSGATITNSGTANGFGSADPASADGDTLGTASLEWSDLFLADGGIIKFGNDQEITLTHNADTGLTLNGVMVATTVEPSADTAAGDNAAIGYTSAEGLILTGQGSTDDVTIKNDADATVLQVATGTTNVEITAGNLIIGTSGKGIDFSVTSDSSGTMGSEVLDDYEEGVWTAAFAMDSGSSDMRAGAATGGYTKIGRLVHIQGAIVSDNTSSPTGQLTITGLPFAADSGSTDMSDRSAGSISPWAITGTLAYPVCWIEGGAAYFYIQDGSTRANAEANHLVDDGEWRFSLDYQAAEL